MRRLSAFAQRIRSLSVGRKLLLIYVFGIFVPLLVANGLVLRGALQEVAAQEREFLVASVESIRDAVAREIEPIELAADFVYTERSIYVLLNQEYDLFADFMEAHRNFLVPALDKYAFVVPGISRITVYTENDIVGVSAGYLAFTETIAQSEWLSRFEGTGTDLLMLVHTDENPRTEVFPADYVSLVRELDATTLPRSGRLILRIDVNPLVLTRHLVTESLTGSIRVLDATGRLAVQADRGAATSVAETIRVPFSFAGPLSGWSVEADVSLAAPVVDPTYRWTLLLVVSGLSVAFSSILILLISRSMTLRLQQLSRQMHRVEGEDFSPIVLDRPGYDEVGQLIADYNLMAGKMESLINDRYRAEIEHNQLVVARQQAELDALQSQVNPHYLFNVLESVRMKSHIRGEHETAQVVKQISRSIRRLASWDEDLVPISEELEFTREYVQIQQYRFGDRLQARIDADPQSLDVLLPKLTIQGLVENACVHGLEPQTEGGEVTVRVGIDAGVLSLVIADDGVGCEPSVVASLIRGRPGASRHIGVANIYRRLKLHFGEDADFAFDSEPGRGTTIRITLQGVPAHAPTPHR